MGCSLFVFAVALTLAQCSGNSATAKYPVASQDAATGNKEAVAAQKVSPQDIVHISVERIALAPRDKNDVMLIRADETMAFANLSRVLVERRFFDLKSDYNQEQYSPDMDTMRITVSFGNPRQSKIVTRWMPQSLDDAWEFEMLIRGAATRYAEELKARQPKAPQTSALQAMTRDR